MTRPCSVRNRLLDLLSDSKPRSIRELAQGLGLSLSSSEDVLYRGWMRGFFLRSQKPFRELFGNLKGRRGLVLNTRSFYLYRINSQATKEINEVKFLAYKKREARIKKTRPVLDFFRQNKDRAFYTRQICDALKATGVKIFDVPSNLR